MILKEGDMHIPDGFVSGRVNTVTAVAAIAAIAIAVRKTKVEVKERPYLVPFIALISAFIFAAQMLNFPVAYGTSGHFLGSALACFLFGPWNAILIMSLVLVIQAVGFQDGGLTALGSNIFNMGIIGVGVSKIVMDIMAKVSRKKSTYILAAGIAGWLSVVSASIACALELAISGTSNINLVLPAMAGIHALIGIGEALITVAVLNIVIAARSDIITGLNIEKNKSILTGNIWKFILTGLVVSLILAGFLSPFASEYPDGLERVAENYGFIEKGKEIWNISIFPDYKVPLITQEGISTGLAGIFGTLIIFIAGFLILKFIFSRRVSDNLNET